jgi:hypothetical protein
VAKVWKNGTSGGKMGEKWGKHMETPGNWGNIEKNEVNWMIWMEF